MHKLIVNLLIPLLCGGAAIALDHWANAFDALNRAVYDTMLRQREAPRVDDRLVLFLVDDRTIDKLDYPVPRTDHAKLIDALRQAGAARTVWDFLFDRARPSEDVVLAGSMKKLPTVLALSGRKPSDDELDELPPSAPLTEMVDPRIVEPDTRAGIVASVEAFGVGRVGSTDVWHAPPAYLRVQSDPAFLAAAGNAGHVADFTDADGVYRGVPPVVRVGNRMLPHMSVAAVMDMLGIGREDVQLKPREALILGHEKLGADAIRIPLDERGYMLINYVPQWQSSGKIDARSYLNQLESVGEFPEDFADSLGQRTIFVGESMMGSGDFVAIPTDTEHQVPGVLVPFNAANTILTGQFLTPAPPMLRWSLAIIAPLCIGLVFWGRTPLVSSIAAIVIIALLVGSSQYLFFRHDYVLPMATPLFAVVLAMILVVGISHLREYGRASHLATVLSRFVSPALMHELDRTGTARALPPVARKELTIMFVDMAGFTRLSDRHEPVEVAAFLVQFYELAIDVINRNRGTLDKVLGDGILAYWGAPRDVPDKEQWACRAALELQERFDVLARQQATKGWGELKLRCGVTTGYVSTGYLGGAKHAAYTIVGRAVNLASRIQSAAENGTCVLDRMTAMRVEGRFELAQRPPVKAKGLDEPVEIWRLVTEKTV